jgi:hypothetical protein
VTPTVAVLPQNDTHLETTTLLVPALEAAGWRVRVVDLDAAYGQRLDFGPLGDRVVRVPIEAAVPFYLAPPRHQARTVSRATGPISLATADADAVLAFNDGALQRIALRAVRRRGGRTYLLIDGMVSDFGRRPGWRLRARGWLQRANRSLAATVAGPYLPSEIGMWPVDAMFVVGAHTADVLRRRGARAARILPTGLPRWPAVDPGPRPERVREVVYLAGAYQWHGLADSAAAQRADVAMLAEVCRRAGIALTVRAHPRDPSDQWSKLAVRVIDPRAQAMRETLLNADLVTSMASTGLLEAISVGRLSMGAVLSAPWEPFGTSFVADPMLLTVRSAAAAADRLALLAQGIADGLYDAQRAGLARYVAADGQEAVERVVAEVTRT